MNPLVFAHLSVNSLLQKFEKKKKKKWLFFRFHPKAKEEEFKTI